MKIESGEIFIIPTDTVLGMGALYDDEVALQRLYQIKKRSQNKPIAILISNINQLECLGIQLSEMDYDLVMKYWPGAYTFIMENIQGEKVGVRMPDHSLALEFITEQEKPIFCTSVNYAGEQAAIKLSEVPVEIKDEVEYIIHDDAIGDKASNVIDLVDKKIMRGEFQW